MIRNALERPVQALPLLGLGGRKVQLEDLRRFDSRHAIGTAVIARTENDYLIDPLFKGRGERIIDVPRTTYRESPNARSQSIGNGEEQGTQDGKGVPELNHKIHRNQDPREETQGLEAARDRRVARLDIPRCDACGMDEESNQ